MVQSKAKTVKQYLAELPPERREIISKVRKTILENLPRGYSETMNWGMISYEIPLKDYPDTYNNQPLSYLALAAQKNNYSLYMMGVYQDSKQETKLKKGFKKAGKKLDMGKSCVRFRKLEDIPLDVIGELIASTPPEAMIERYEKSRKK
jgi:hypothetical protein